MERLDVAIVGAGFSGLYMLHKARGLGLSARVFEAAEDLQTREGALLRASSGGCSGGGQTPPNGTSKGSVEGGEL